MQQKLICADCTIVPSETVLWKFRPWEKPLSLEAVKKHKPEYKETGKDFLAECRNIGETLNCDFSIKKTSPENLKTYFEQEFTDNSILLSNDHLTTKAGIETVVGKNPIEKKSLGIIVLDRHVDIWPEYLCGEKVNKFNVFRKIAESEFGKYLNCMVFIGGLSMEKIHLPPVVSAIEEQGIELEIISFLDVESDFEKAVERGAKILKEDGTENIALSIDLDCFDCNEILGVEYNKLNLVYDYCYAWAIENLQDEEVLKNIEKDAKLELKKYKQAGISIEKIREKASKVGDIFKQTGLNRVYTDITEYEPKYDFNGKTKELVLELCKGLG